MRSIELAKVAAAAEALRLRRIARRQAFRAVYGVVAAVFILAILVGVHVMLWIVLAGGVTPVQASLIVLGVDALIAAIFGFMATRNSPDMIELEAKAIRHQALVEMRESLRFMSLVAQTANMAMRAGAANTARRAGPMVLAEVASRLFGR
jgi:hypothetical protein